MTVTLFILFIMLFVLSMGCLALALWSVAQGGARRKWLWWVLGAEWALVAIAVLVLVVGTR